MGRRRLSRYQRAGSQAQHHGAHQEVGGPEMKFVPDRVARVVPLGVLLALAVTSFQGQQTAPDKALVDRYCIGCHSERLKSGNLVLEKLDAEHASEHPEIWEKVV